MSRYERNEFFERLVELRASYARLPEDTRGVLLIEDAINYVVVIMLAYEVEETLEAEAAALDAATAQPAGAEPTT
jgi:hypothetical protein